jgi:hypothetical protein
VGKGGQGVLFGTALFRVPTMGAAVGTAEHALRLN